MTTKQQRQLRQNCLLAGTQRLAFVSFASDAANISHWWPAVGLVRHSLFTCIAKSVTLSSPLTFLWWDVYHKVE